MPIMVDPNRIDRLNTTPGAGAASYRGDAVAAAQYGTAQSLGQIGAAVSQEAAKKLTQLDDLRVIEAASELRNKELELTFGKYGYATVKGGDVLKGQYYDGYKARYQNEADNILNTLSPAQQEKFKAHVFSSSAQFQAGVLRHSMAESEKYAGDVFAADIKSRVAQAAAHYNNPMVIASTVTGVDAAMEKRMRDLGIGDADPTLRDQFVKGVRGTLHSAVLDKAVNDQNTVFARQYFEANKENMTGDQIEAFEKKFKPMNDFVQGKNIADEVFAIHNSKDKPNNFNPLTVIAEKAKGNPQVEAQAQSLFVQYEQGKAIVNAEKKGTVLKQFNDAPTRQMMNALKGSPEYVNLTDSAQAEVSSFMRQTVESRERQDLSDARAAQSNARAEENFLRTEQIWNQNQLTNSPAAIKTMVEAQRNPDFPNWSIDYLNSLAPVVGVEGVKHLITAQDQMKKGIAKFRIDQDLIDQGRPPSKGDKLAYEGLVEILTQRHIQENGTPPNLDQQIQIIRKASETKWVDDTGVFGKALWNTEKPVYKLPPEQREFYFGVIDAAKKAGKPVPTDSDINRMWENRDKFKVQPKPVDQPKAADPLSRAKEVADPATLGYAAKMVQDKAAAEAQLNKEKAWGQQLIAKEKAEFKRLKDEADAADARRAQRQADRKAQKADPNLRPVSMFQSKEGKAMLESAPPAKVEVSPLEAVVVDLAKNLGVGTEGVVAPSEGEKKYTLTDVPKMDDQTLMHNFRKFERLYSIQDDVIQRSVGKHKKTSVKAVRDHLNQWFNAYDKEIRKRGL